MIGNGVAGIIVSILRIATKSVYPDNASEESVDMFVSFFRKYMAVVVQLA